jgi:hypothetical protein
MRSRLTLAAASSLYRILGTLAGHSRETIDTKGW